MNAFDFIITIALGSSLSIVALNKNISLADGITAIGLFIGLQFLLTWLSVRIKAVKNLITSNPTFIFYNGNFLKSVMNKQRITEEEIYSAGRQKSIPTLDEVDMIILETTGEITIIKKKTNGMIPTFEDVEITS